nr:copper resistance protein CopC [Demequina sediminis]
MNGPDGQEWGDGATTVSGATVTQRLGDGLPAGDFQVAWRSVSGDGHPVDGTFRFTVEAAPESASTSEPSPERADEGATPTWPPTTRCSHAWPGAPMPPPLGAPSNQGPPSARRRCRGTERLPGQV